MVYGFGSTKTPQAFKSVCTRFIDVDQLIKTSQAQETVPSAATQSVAAENLTADTELMELIGAAYKEAKRDEEGWARVQQVGQIAGNRSSFDVRNYGFSSLSAMFRNLPNFKVERREGAELWVKRLR